jgi:hypothetical protein
MWTYVQATPPNQLCMPKYAHMHDSGRFRSTTIYSFLRN